MVVKEMEVVAEGNLVLDRELLKEAGLGEHVRVIIRKGEIRILAEPAIDAEKELDELAGSLGQEPAAEYDFGLKIAGLYDAR